MIVRMRTPTVCDVARIHVVFRLGAGGKRYTTVKPLNAYMTYAATMPPPFINLTPVAVLS
jgi:hypothetical protein